MAGNFFTVGIELLAGNFCPDAGRLERVLNMRQALDHLRIALLHWQFEVDDQFAAKFLGNPFGGQGAAAGGLVDDVADHPVNSAFGLVHVAVGLHVLDLSAVHQAAIHGAVVDGNHLHQPVDQLPGPAAGGGAKVDRCHACLQAHVPVITRDKVVPRLFQFQRRAARRFFRYAQTGNPHRPGRAIVSPGPANKHLLATLEAQVQARQLSLVRAHKPGFGQRAFKRPLELFGKRRERLAIIGIGGFQPDQRGNRALGTGGNNGADAIFRIEIDPAA